MRYKSIENVVAEFRLLYERYGVTLFMPEDDLFTANKKRTLALLEAIRALGIPGFRMQFPVALAVNTLTHEVIDSLIKSGLDVASLAIESGSADTQHRIIKKDVNLDKAREWCAICAPRTSRSGPHSSWVFRVKHAMMDEFINSPQPGRTGTTSSSPHPLPAPRCARNSWILATCPMTSR